MKIEASLGRLLAIGLRLLSLLALSVTLLAQGMQAMDDAALSEVNGRDGMAFDISGFQVSGNASFTYYTDSTQSQSVTWSNLFATRSDSGIDFFDPYVLSTITGPDGLANVTSITFPQNTGAGLTAAQLAQWQQENWQLAFDWSSTSAGTTFNGGSVVVNNLAFFGGGFQIGDAPGGTGTNFGLDLRADIGALTFLPNGRSNTASATVNSSDAQMSLNGIHIGAADSNGNWLNTPWQIADVNAQPGFIYYTTDSGGSYLQAGIESPTAGNTAGWGAIKIDDIKFSSAPVGGLTDLGSSQIGAIQIQSMTIKFK